MIREARMRGAAGKDADGFRLRGREVTRLESFCDAVFGFAVTLLVVSLEVPKSFNELMETMRGFLAFGVCFAILVMIWTGGNCTGCCDMPLWAGFVYLSLFIVMWIHGSLHGRRRRELKARLAIAET